MSDRPHVICLMSTSVDGGLHPSRFTDSREGVRKDWSALYEQLHGRLAGDAWLVGRATMAEMAKGEPHPPAESGRVERPTHFAKRGAKQYAIAVDTRGGLHFRSPDVAGDHVVVLLGGGVSDQHLAELAGDGVSYVVSDGQEVDLAAGLATLKRELGIERLILEGGATINGGMMAAGLVDELHVIVAPALDARAGADRFVSAGEDGLKGKVELSLLDCVKLDHGALHLSYSVTPSRAA